MEQVQLRRAAKARALPRRVVAGAIAQAKKGYEGLKKRYGPKYTYGMVSVAFFTFFLPVPGISLVCVTLVVAVAEIHRALLKRSGGANPKELVMSMNCDITLKWSATPEQLRALGGAFWRWCNRAQGNTRIHQHLDNQALADLIAGKFPAALQAQWPVERRGIHFRVRDEASHDRRATLDSLRRTIPTEGVADILVDDVSWNPVASQNAACASL